MGPPSLAFDAARDAAGRATQLQPVVFGGHAGALHSPVGQAARGVAVVLCPPIGRDARCAYRPLFLFAEALAADGFPVLRYEHLGCGDSMPLEPEVDRWPLWLAGVEQAAAFVRAHAGAQRLVLAGLRVGASLAAAAACSVKPDGLMLLAPLATGRAWIRELQASAATSGPPPADGSIEIDGLRLSPATVASLKDVDLRRLPPSGAEAFLATPAADPRLVASLGARVKAVRFPGYSELFREAHLNAPPGVVIEAATAWIEGFAAGAPDAARVSTPPAPSLVTPDWTERPIIFGEDLRGVLCLPARAAGGQGVIIGNTGADPRAGIAGFAARACRALATRGVAALRFDFAGLGESAGPDGWRSHVFGAPRAADFRAAADLLAREGYGEPTLVGVCTGGYQAVRAAIEDPRFRRIVAINPWLLWQAGDSLEKRPVGASLRRGIVGSGPNGPLPARGPLGGLLHRLRRRFQRRPRDEAGRSARTEIARIAAAGARLQILMGRDDIALEELEANFGAQGRWLARRRGVEIALARDLDHGLVTRRSQDLALAAILRFLDLAPEVEGAGGEGSGGARGPASSASRQAAV